MPMDDHYFMGLALEQAKLAYALGEVPIGAVMVLGQELLSAAHNRRELDADPAAHAELLALREAAAKLGRWRLTDCTVYVTLEPCLMCAGAMVQARIGRCVYAAADPKGGALGSLYQVHTDARLNHNFPVTAKVRELECADLLRSFFAALRQRPGPARGVC
ncbi:MAG: tRNA adenosine(34) deaminase TadA [Actinomycetia bacterium]|nr:tRNA adenosine(34) deaminase TadA [Actinomycetes bacterium]